MILAANLNYFYIKKEKYIQSEIEIWDYDHQPMPWRVSFAASKDESRNDTNYGEAMVMVLNLYLQFSLRF